tara:strand:- start:1380 stop:4460 length:3081 start_codon:yes stop_codon:yes gene_type:complete
MLSPKLTNCKGCADIPDLLRRIDCKLAELGNNINTTLLYKLNRPIAVTDISQLLVYKRVLMFRYCDTHYATRCPEISTEDIASKVIRLTAGCVSLCNEPTVCEITTCAIKPCPNPTTTTTSTSSTSTTSTTSTSSTTTSTTTINCNFTGVIDCSITTTTTTTPPPTTTTTTSYFPDAFGIPCLWSTNGGNPGNLAVYNFDTNTATEVLVPNDFTTTVGIERPICATEDKLWLASVLDQGSNSNYNDDVVYIREWNIDGTTPNAPTLTYVREITVLIGQYSGANLGGTAVQAMTAISNDRLIIGTGNLDGQPSGTGGSGSIYVQEFNIASGGNITISGNDMSSSWAASGGSNAAKLSNLTYTNSGQLVLGYRTDLRPDGSGSAGNVGNYLRVFPTTPSDPDFSINNTAIQIIKLQEQGYPEFTNTYVGPKDAPFWGVNGLAQVLQPETLNVYTLDQLPQQTFPGGYQLSLTTNVSSSNDWLSSATNCSNIEFSILDSPDCGLTYFPPFFELGSQTYLGPQTFQYAGMTCTASLSNTLTSVRTGLPSNIGMEFLGCSGLVKPQYPGVGVTKSVIVQGNDFSITIDFPQPVNNIPIRAGVLNSTTDGTGGDVYYVDTNGGPVTLSINQGCFAQVNGNRLFGGVANPPGEPDAYSNEGDGEFKVTSTNSFTSMTIYGNAPTGGPLFLGCPPINCDNMFFIEQGGSSCNAPENAGLCPIPPVVPVNQTSFTKMYVWNKLTDVCTEVTTPIGEGFASGDTGIGNNIIVMSSNINTSSTFKEAFIKYTYDNVNDVPGNLQWDGVQYELPTVWKDYNNNSFIPNLEVIDDQTIGVIVTTSVAAPEYRESKFLVCTFPTTGTEMIVEEKFTLSAGHIGSGDIVVTYKVDGVTPNKVLVLGGIDIFLNGNVLDSILAVQQYDYATGALEVTTRSTDFAVDPTMGGAYLAIVDDELYAGANLACKISFTAPYAWTQLNANERSCPAGGAGTLPGCRKSDGFIIDPNVTTTTTSSTTTIIPPGVRTIFTKFYPIVTNN